MLNKKYKLLIIFYILIVFFFILVAVKDHKEQDFIEHFNVSMMKRKERRKKHSECKTKCEVKYKDEDVKVCKNYCKCKKKCNGDKKCLKNCKNIKMNIFRNDKNKIKKIEVKDKIKNLVRQERREKKKEEKKKLMENNIKTKTQEEEKISYVDSVIDKYFSEQDKENLISTSNDVKSFFKDVKSVFRIKK